MFYVPKVVRSPGCDHGHDEESCNGRDMKIAILDDYIRTSEWFRGLSDIYRSTGGLPERPRGLLGLMGPKWWKSRGSRRWRAAPLAPIRIGKGKGAAAPLLLPSLHLILPPSPTPTRKGGVLLPVGVGLPLGVPSSLAGRLPPLLLYIRGQRAPHGHNN